MNLNYFALNKKYFLKTMCPHFQLNASINYLHLWLVNTVSGYFLNIRSTLGVT